MLRRIIALVSLSAVSSCCLALPSTPTGSCVQGRTVDTLGAAIGQSTITVQAMEGGASNTALSNSSGQFQVCLLPMGQYQVIAHRGGFKDSVHIETLGDGQNVSIDFQLQRSETGESKPATLSDLEKTTGVDPFKSNSGNPGGVASGSIREFSIATDLSGAQNIPDAPSSSKTNTPHGQIYGFVGPNLVGSTDVTIGTQLPISQFGVSLGGTIDQGRSSYFVSYDQYGINRQRLLADLAGQIGMSNTGLSTIANVLTSSALASRVDRQFSSRDSGYLRFDRDEMHGNSLQRGQDTNLPSGTAGLNVVQQNVAVGNTVNVSPSTINETRAQFISTDVQVAAGAAAIGLQSTLPTDRHSRVFEAANNVYRQVGSQSLRMGGDFLYNQMNISLLQTSLGRTAAIGPSLSQSAQDVGLYVLGQRQLRSNLLVTTGVRYDAESMRGFQTDRNNFSPQVGFAWSPGPYGTVLRAGFGMTYDRLPLPAFAGSTDPNGVANLNLSTKINNPGGTSLGDLGTFQTISPSIQNSYAQLASLEAEQQVGRKSTLSAQYQYVRGVQLALPVHRTAALCASVTGCNAENEFTGQQIGSGAVSSYNGISVAFTQQPVRWGNYKVSYTYSTAEGSGSGANTSYIDDRMRRVSFTGVLHTSLDPSATLWQRVTHGFLLSGTTDYLSRSEFLGMNFINLNARLTKNLTMGSRFHLEAIAETFNMLQRSNASFAKAAAEMGESANEIFSTYNRVATAQSPNGTQAGLRLSF
jgi:hypothetical protein